MKYGTIVLALALTGSYAAADSISLTNGGGPTPAGGDLSYTVGSTTDYHLRFFNTIELETNVLNTSRAINGSLNSVALDFASIGSSEADGTLGLGFSSSFTFTNSDTIVFGEYGINQDQPFDVTVLAGGNEVSLTGTSGAGFTMTSVDVDIANGVVWNIYTLDLSDAVFGLNGVDTYNQFQISSGGSIGAFTTPDIGFAGVVVPLPPSAWAGCALLGGLLGVRVVRRKH